MVGCRTYGVRPTIQDTEIINAPFDKVWEALIATITKRGYSIEAVEKTSGLLTTQLFEFSPMVIDSIAVKSVSSPL